MLTCRSKNKVRAVQSAPSAHRAHYDDEHKMMKKNKEEARRNPPLTRSSAPTSDGRAEISMKQEECKHERTSRVGQGTKRCKPKYQYGRAVQEFFQPFDHVQTCHMETCTSINDSINCRRYSYCAKPSNACVSSSSIQHTPRTTARPTCTHLASAQLPTP